jgi:hypothetical protein
LSTLKRLLDHRGIGYVINVFEPSDVLDKDLRKDTAVVDDLVKNRQNKNGTAA